MSGRPILYVWEAYIVSLVGLYCMSGRPIL